MLDRKVQLGILKALEESYPAQIAPGRHLFPQFQQEPVVYNLAYLDEHGLTESSWSQTMNRAPFPTITKITAKGLDFLSDDGGLSSILGVVTVKLHQETIIALITDRIEKSDAPPSIKKRLVETLKGLPSEALQQVALKVMEAGLDRLDLSQWLDKLLSS